MARIKQNISTVCMGMFLCFFYTGAQELDNYQWKNRILLLKDDSLNSESLQEQLQELKKESTALTERDLEIILIAQKVFSADGKEIKLSAPDILEEYALKDFNGIVLIGKDGGVKLMEPFVTPPEKIFSLIDGMPMRRAEMRNNLKKKSRPEH